MSVLIIRQKRGALELSINAIVVLILAITMLGLGLGFMRNMFGKTTGQFDEISAELKNQMIDQIKAGNDKVILNKYEIEIKRAEKKTYYFGIKNIESGRKTFYTDVKCTDAIAEGVSESQANDYILFYTFDTVDVEGGDVAVVPLNIQSTTSAQLTTYKCNINVYTTQTKTPESLYGTKSFYVTLQ